jgi:hypothetical protein
MIILFVPLPLAGDNTSTTAVTCCKTFLIRVFKNNVIHTPVFIDRSTYDTPLLLLEILQKRYSVITRLCCSSVEYKSESDSWSISHGPQLLQAAATALQSHTNDDVVTKALLWTPLYADACSTAVRPCPRVLVTRSFELSPIAIQAAAC